MNTSVNRQTPHLREGGRTDGSRPVCWTLSLFRCFRIQGYTALSSGQHTFRLCLIAKPYRSVASVLGSECRVSTLLRRNVGRLDTPQDSERCAEYHLRVPRALMRRAPCPIARPSALRGPLQIKLISAHVSHASHVTERLGALRLVKCMEWMSAEVRTVVSLPAR
jgi:hypothetical protein